MKRVVYENAWKFRVEIFKAIGLAFCTPAAAIVLKGLIENDFWKRIFSSEMLIAMFLLVLGLMILNGTFRLLSQLDEVECSYDD